MLRVGEEALLHRQREPHRFARQQRQQHRHAFRLHVVLGAETAADIRHLHRDAVLRQLEHARDLFAQRKRVLAARPDFDPIGPRVGDADERLEVVVRHAREAELVFEHMVASGERVGAAGCVGKLVADVLARPQHRARTRTVRRHDAGGGVLEEGRHAVGERRFDAGGHRKVVVVDADRAQRRNRLRFAVGRDGADDVADVAHRVDRDDRLILDVVAVERHHVHGNVVARQHGAHAGHRSRGRSVDACHACVRSRAAQHFGVQHAGQHDVGAVDRAAADLGVRVAARGRDTHLFERGHRFLLAGVAGPLRAARERQSTGERFTRLAPRAAGAPRPAPLRRSAHNRCSGTRSS